MAGKKRTGSILTIIVLVLVILVLLRFVRCS